MSSALESIREIKARQAEEQRSAKIHAEEEIRIAEANAKQWQNEWDRKKEQERKVAKEIGTRILNETGIVEQLKEIEREECSDFPKHAIVIDFHSYVDFSPYPEQVLVELAWGKKFSVSSDTITYKSSLFNKYRGSYDYYSIRARIITQTEEIAIIGQNQTNITKEERKAKPEVIAEAIAQTFLKPYHYYGNYPSGQGNTLPSPSISSH